MKFIILLVLWTTEAGFPTLTIVDNFQTVKECKASVEAASRKYPEAAKAMVCLPVVQEGYNDPI